MKCHFNSWKLQKIETAAQISSLPKKLEIELKSDFLDNFDSKWFLKVTKMIK